MNRSHKLSVCICMHMSTTYVITYCIYRDQRVPLRVCLNVISPQLVAMLSCFMWTQRQWQTWYRLCNMVLTECIFFIFGEIFYKLISDMIMLIG